MGKNAMHKSMQRARHVGGTEDGAVDPGLGDGTVDASFHTPEWHAARIAALTTERMSWEDWKKKQKDDAAREAAAGADEERAMREYRAQLDADRAAKLAKGTNHAHLREAVRPRCPSGWCRRSAACRDVRGGASGRLAYVYQ